MKNNFLHSIVPLLFFVTVTAVPAQGQTLHAILFADTQDASVGRSDLQDFYSISVEVSTIASATGLNLKSYYYKDNLCSSKNLRSVLENLSTNREDVIIFYYTGHGTRSAQDESDFPQMCLASSDPMKFYPLEKVLVELERQPARLKLVLGDCCNNVVYGVPPKNIHSKGATILTKNPVSVYQGLFLGNKGFLIASGSQAGETSAAMYNAADNSPIGGAFTNSLLATLKGCASKGMAASWEEVMQGAQQRTYGEGGHTPVYNVVIKDASIADEEPQQEQAAEQSVAAPPVQEYQEPQNMAQPDEKEEIENIVLLTAIGNENLSVEKRVKAQDKALTSLFSSPQAKVEVVGSNGTTIVATEKAEDFVLRLCTAHNLINLVELEKTVDSNGKYTYLKVHEIYKR